MDMKTFDANGVEIAYLDEGEGAPILLIHGFASTAHVNWVNTGWVKTLVDAGRRVIAIDNRGHGRSEKLYDEALYRPEMMAGDALALIDHLALQKADVMGYSMGSRISVFLAMANQDRVDRIILGGMGEGLVKGIGGSDIISAALLAPSIDEVDTKQGRMFRAFAEQTGSDLEALAACMRATRVRIRQEDVARIERPTLIATGTKDEVVGDPHALAAMMPNAQVLEITGRDHMLAVGDRIFKQGAVEFLGQPS